MENTFANYPANDSEWEDSHWKGLLEYLLQHKIVTYKEIASLVLGHINPPQVGTSIASNKSFQENYPKGKTWRNVREWSYTQSGICVDCGTRLELQADHIIPKEQEGEDKLENMTYRCRRCNVVKRPSHQKGGITFLTTEAALMWLIFTQRPKKYEDYKLLCREYGLTMADIRFQEAWAIAKWLERISEYEIDSDSKY